MISSLRSCSTPWERDRHVDSHHSDFDIKLELPRGAAVAGKDGGTVPERIGIDDMKALVISVDAHDRQHGTEDLVVIAGSSRLHVVDKRSSKKETIAAARRVPPAVYGKPSAVRFRAFEIGGNAVAVLSCDQRTHRRKLRGLDPP